MSDIIKGPGKFEGEPLYAPYFYDLMMDGNADADYVDQGAAFIVSPEDLEKYPKLLLDVYAVVLWEDGNGFVFTSELSTEAEYDAWCHDAELAAAAGT